jgi:transposase
LFKSGLFFDIISLLKQGLICKKMSESSVISIKQLHEENARLLALLTQKDTTIQQQKSSIENLQHQLHLFRTARFGRKSEKGVVNEQLALQFDEAIPVQEAELAQEEPQTETLTYTRNKKGTGRKALPKSLPYIEKVYDLTHEEKQCSCGCELSHISDEVTEQLDVVPQMTFRVIHIRKKYACKHCEQTIQLAQLPKQPIDKSMASAGLLAAVIDSKFNRHMPLYRQEAMFHEAGLSVTRGTLSNWLIHSAKLLTPLVKLMEDIIQTYDVAYADETTLQVLKEKGRAPSQQSYMWLFSGGPPNKRVFVYQYHQTRSHQIPLDFFADFKGYVHADCYKAYVSLGELPSIQHVACLAHARRYFVDVVKASKKEGLAHQVVKLFSKLYELEKKLKEQGASIETIFNERQQLAKPIFNELKTLLDESQLKVLPKSPLGTAVFYTLAHWDSLSRYLVDGRLEIDNNRSERAIKPFVIGRKNWLFHGNEIGANAGAILFSLIETCKQHQVDVFAWLKYTLGNIHHAHTIEALELLLPFNVNSEHLEHMRNIPKLIFPNKQAVS